MKLLLPSETKVECNIKTLKAFENYINLINDNDIATLKFISIAKAQLKDHFARGTLNKRNLRIYPVAYWDMDSNTWKRASSENLKNRIREFEELMKNED